MLKKGVFKGFFIVLPLDTRHVVGTGRGQQGREVSGPTLRQQAEPSPHCEQTETSGGSWMNPEGGTSGTSAKGGKKKRKDFTEVGGAL